MQEPDLDIETLRRPRRERLAAFLSAPLREITHLGWLTATAIVVACRQSTYVDAGEGAPSLADYIVEFSYTVGGRTFTGVLDSPVEVQPGDTFNIRYNPTNPEENNSLGSPGHVGTRIGSVIIFLLILLIVAPFLLQLLRRFPL